MSRAIALRSGLPLLERLFRRVIDRGTRKPPWSALDPDVLDLDDATRARAITAWSTRMNTEYLSMTLFAELAARAAEIGHPLEVTVGLSRLVQDEARHSELCARVCAALGGPDHPSLPVEELSMATPPRVEPRLAFTRWVLGMFSVGEATSVSLLRAMTRGGRLRNPCVEAVLTTLHQDEVVHDAFGWALLRLLVPTHTEEERDWLASELAQALAFYEHLHAGAFLVEGSAELPARARSRPTEDATVGVLAPVEHARVFYERVERVILPRLDEMGIGAYEAWSLRRDVPITIRPV